MRFEMKKQQCLLTNFNPRRELHGEDPQPAADVHFSTNLASGDLAQFHPALRSLLYHYDSSKADLADQGGDDEAPHLRLADLHTPLRWKGDMVGAKVTIHHGVSEKSNIVLDGSTCSDFKIEPKEGGTITVGFRVQAHPDEKQAGKIYTLQGAEVDVTIQPPAPPADLDE